MQDDDKFYRDLMYKMMGFGMAVLLIYMGWMLGTGDKEKFIRPWVKTTMLQAEAKTIALRYGKKCSDEYKNKLEEVECALLMRKDRGWSLIGFFIGSLFWVRAIFWARSKIQDCNQRTVLKRGFIWVYCFLVVSPQLLAMCFIFKDISFSV